MTAAPVTLMASALSARTISTYSCMIGIQLTPHAILLPPPRHGTVHSPDRLAYPVLA